MCLGPGCQPMGNYCAYGQYGIVKVSSLHDREVCGVEMPLIISAGYHHDQGLG